MGSMEDSACDRIARLIARPAAPRPAHPYTTPYTM